MKEWLLNLWNAVVGFVSMVELTDILDIVIVGFLIYKAIQIFR